MPSIFLKSPLPDEERALLESEFSQHTLIDTCETAGDWHNVEILFGNELTENELQMATRLRWIHTTTSDIEGLCFHAIQKREEILISVTKGQNVPQMAEFVIGGVLAFAKQFFHWPKAPHDPLEFADWPLKDTMWTLNQKTFVQVGLGEVGSAIVHLANQLGMKTWGVRRQRSFHPECRRTFGLDHLHSILPQADVVAVALPRRGRREVIFTKQEFELMKHDSIFIVVGGGDFIDDKALAEAAKTGKFRGVLLDAFENWPLGRQSPLWKLPNVLLTPKVATYPLSEEHLAFRLFRRNLRSFVRGKINEMKNVILSYTQEQI